MKLVKQLSLIWTFLFAFILGYGQSVDEIMHSGQYLWGMGVSGSYETASKHALDDLISKISVEVKSSFENYVREENDSIRELTKTMVKTYSTGHLEGTESRVQEDEETGKTTVYRYIKKDNLDKIFENRKHKVLTYVDLGFRAEEKLKIGDALRNYYHALVLLRSLPDYNSLNYAFEGQPEMLLSAQLQQRLNDLLDNLDIRVHKVLNEPGKERVTYTISINYDGRPVGNLDYMYFAGNQYIGPIGAKDGYGEVELFGNYATSTERIRILVEYKYQNTSDSELMNVMQNTPPPPDFKKSAHWLYLPQNDDISRLQAKRSSLRYHAPQQKDIHVRDYKRIVEDIGKAIEEEDAGPTREYFTEEGYAMYNKLIRNGNAKVLPLQDTIRIVEVNGEVIVRSLPMVFSHSNNSRKFLEDVVFTFNKDRKVDAVSFALSERAINDIMNKPEPWGTLEERYLLVQFMEYYKTAYCLKRLDYIESVFADNALIIVGHVFEKDDKPLDAMYMNLGGEKVRYIRHTKESYIRALRNVFQSNEFVNIHFEDNEVSRTNRLDDKVYGIQIAQHYYSSTYADKGYLFLMIDLNDTMNPKIYVRSWQPEKNPDGSIIGLRDFHF